MAKFNLKNYQKIDGDEHIDAKLQETHKEAPNEVNEAQLEEYRATEPEVITEKQLEKARGGDKEEFEIVEKRLDTDKAKFANKYRNPEAYEGDINKLEEKRLLGDPVEDEKYDDASETPQKFRWWEDAPKSPDGLKLAQKKTAQRTQELTFKKPRWDDTVEEGFSPLENEGVESAEEAAIRPIDPIDIKQDYEIEDFADVDFIPGLDTPDGPDNNPPMRITKQRTLTDPTYGIYMVIGYNADDFMGDEQSIKQSAMDKVLEERPELKGFIGKDDFGDIKETGAIGEVKLRLLDEKLAEVLGSKEVDVVDVAPFTEDSYEVQDLGGTPMAMGSVKVNVEVTAENRAQVIEDAVEFVQKVHPSLNITQDSMDFSKLSEGEVGFLIETSSPSLSKSEFPISEVTAQSFVKKN